MGQKENMTQKERKEGEKKRKRVIEIESFREKESERNL